MTTKPARINPNANKLIPVGDACSQMVNAATAIAAAKAKLELVGMDTTELTELLAHADRAAKALGDTYLEMLRG